MRNLIATLILIVSASAQASDFSFVPAVNDQQKEFKEAVTKSRWSKALELWSKAFPGSGFATSDNGRALRIYLFAMNELPVSSTKLLVRETTYENLNANVLELWRPLLETYISEIPQGLMTASWKRHFSSEAVVIKNKKDIPAALTRAQKQVSDLGKAKSLWTIATQAPQFGDTASALNALRSMSGLKQKAIGSDQIELATARVLYQKGDLDEAIKHYNLIPKSSDLWLESVEERAWAHLRKNDHDKAVSDITTVLAPVFAPLTGPESYFLSELSSLQVCDYPRILRVSKLFKERHKERLIELEKLAATGENKALPQVLSNIETKGLSVIAVGPNVKFMPKNFLRDAEFARALQYRNHLNEEAIKAQDVLKSFGGDGELERLLGENSADVAQAKLTALQRLKKMANDDLAEYRVIINKLHIVEAEVIERLYVDETLKGKRRDLVKSQDPRNSLNFPVTDEVWMDELDHYKAAVKDCPALPSTKGASL